MSDRIGTFCALILNQAKLNSCRSHVIAYCNLRALDIVGERYCCSPPGVVSWIRWIDPEFRTGHWFEYTCRNSCQFKLGTRKRLLPKKRYCPHTSGELPREFHP